MATIEALDAKIAKTRTELMNINALDMKQRNRLVAVGRKFRELVDEKTTMLGESWDGSINLVAAGIGEGNERPMQTHYLATPGEIDEEAPRRF